MSGTLLFDSVSSGVTNKKTTPPGTIESILMEMKEKYETEYNKTSFSTQVGGIFYQGWADLPMFDMLVAGVVRDTALAGINTHRDSDSLLH